MSRLNKKNTRKNKHVKGNKRKSHKKNKYVKQNKRKSHKKGGAALNLSNSNSENNITRRENHERRRKRVNNPRFSNQTNPEIKFNPKKKNSKCTCFKQ